MTSTFNWREGENGKLMEGRDKKREEGLGGWSGSREEIEEEAVKEEEEEGRDEDGKTRRGGRMHDWKDGREERMEKG